MRMHFDPKRFLRGLVVMDFPEPEDIELRFRTAANKRMQKRTSTQAATEFWGKKKGNRRYEAEP